MCKATEIKVDLPREYAYERKIYLPAGHLNSSEHYEIIEEYPKDKYFPSYLVYSQFQGKIFHVLFAVDIDEENIRAVTAYYPDPEEWEEDFKTRR